jgi:hypothetical protein
MASPMPKTVRIKNFIQGVIVLIPKLSSLALIKHHIFEGFVKDVIPAQVGTYARRNPLKN